MSAKLYPGIKSLHLLIAQPYDLIRTTDPRDDLQSVKVWYSTTSGFDPTSSGTVLTGLQVTGTSGQFSTTNTNNFALYIGAAITISISGSYTGTGGITGAAFPSTYYVIATNGTTTFTLSSTLGGTAITTTVGTTTGAVATANSGTLYSNSDSLDINITGLESSKQYYVKYALISNIDPDVYTVSSEYAASTLDNTARIVTLTATSQVFVVGKDIAATVTPSTTVLTATTTNMVIPTFTWYLNGTLISGQNSNTLTVSSFSTGTALYKVVATENGSSVFDQLTIYALREGSDSYQAGLSNENQTISCTSDGTPISGQFPVTSQMIVAKGATFLTTGVTYSKVSETGMTSTIDSSGAISVSAISATFASATYRASIDGTSVTIDRVLTINKSTAGATGINTATVALYAVNTSGVTAPATFSGTFTYTFSSSTLTGGTLNGWTTTAPSITKGQYLWVRYAVVASNTATDTIEYTEFSTAVVYAVGGIDGAAGINTATVALYAANTSGVTAPTTFSGTFTYTFSSSTLTGGTLNGWSTSAPSITKGQYLWVRYAVAASNTATDTIEYTEFSTATVLSIGGSDGAKGDTGIDGLRGIANLTRQVSYDLKSQTATYYATTGGAGTVGYECQQAFNDAYTGTVDRTPRSGDRVTLYQTAWSNTYLYAVGGYWSYVALKVDGSLIVDGSILASSLTIASSTNADGIGRIQLSSDKLEVYSGSVRRVVIGKF